MPRRVKDLAAVYFLVASARVAGRWLGTASLINLTVRAARVAGTRERVEPDVEPTLERIQTLTHRAARRVPGANCMHRAAAARIWLAAHGIEARVVVGFRMEDGPHGHAWLEAEGPQGPIRIFCNEHADYRSMFDETQARAMAKMPLKDD